MPTDRPYWNSEAETAPLARLRELQNIALNRQLDHVWSESEFYRRKFGAAEIARAEIRSIEDLPRLPFTEKSELRDSQSAEPPLGLHRACHATAVRRLYSTSGTTGRPTYIGLTGHDIEVWREAACRAFWSAGIRPGDIVPVVNSPFVIAASYTDAFEAIGTAIPIGVNATDRLVAAFQFARANALLATASFPLHFAQSLRNRGIEPRSLGIRIMLCGGEPGASIPAVRAQIEALYGCTLYELAGNGDMCGMMWAECAERRGMHFIAHGIVHPELIDPDTGAPMRIAAGARGELVYTSLDRECIPLVRFRSRDHVEVTHTDCACGRTGFGIRIIGRTDDLLIVRGVNVYPAAIRDVVLQFAPHLNGVIEIQLYQPPPAGWEPPIHIKAEQAGPDIPNGLRDALEARLREKLIFRAQVEFVPEGSLPRYEYKAMLVKKHY